MSSDERIVEAVRILQELASLFKLNLRIYYDACQVKYALILCIDQVEYFTETGFSTNFLWSSGGIWRDVLKRNFLDFVRLSHIKAFELRMAVKPR
jgi:hypothetical protein